MLLSPKGRFPDRSVNALTLSPFNTPTHAQNRRNSGGVGDLLMSGADRTGTGAVSTGMRLPPMTSRNFSGSTTKARKQLNMGNALVVVPPESNDEGGGGNERGERDERGERGERDERRDERRDEGRLRLRSPQYNNGNKRHQQEQEQHQQRQHQDTMRYEQPDNYPHQDLYHNNDDYLSHTNDDRHGRGEGSGRTKGGGRHSEPPKASSGTAFGFHRLGSSAFENFDSDPFFMDDDDEVDTRRRGRNGGGGGGGGGGSGRRTGGRQGRRFEDDDEEETEPVGDTSRRWDEGGLESVAEEERLSDRWQQQQPLEPEQRGVPQERRPQERRPHRSGVGERANALQSQRARLAEDRRQRWQEVAQDVEREAGVLQEGDETIRNDLRKSIANIEQHIGGDGSSSSRKRTNKKKKKKKRTRER